MEKLLGTIDRSLAAVENSMIVALVTIMVLMAFTQVLLRNFFDSGILWGDIFLRHLVLWVGFIGASLATRDEKHISIDALSRLASPRLLPYIKIITDIATIVVCVLLTNAGYRFVASEKEAHTILFKINGLGDIQAWIFQLIIPLGFGLIAFRFFLKLVERIWRILQPSAQN